MVEYNKFPSMDADYNMPPEVRAKLAESSEFTQNFAGVDSFGIPVTRTGLRVSTASPVDLRDHYDREEPPSDYSAAILSALVEANETAGTGWVREVYIPEGVWDVKTTVSATDLSVVLKGPGLLNVWSNSGLMTVNHQFGTGITGSHTVLRAKVDANSDSATNYAKHSIFTPTDPNSLKGLKNGDLVFLDSNTYYTPAWVSSSDSHTYKGQYFPVAGIGLTVDMVAGNGGVPAQAVITGAESNAKATVLGNQSIKGTATTNVTLTLTNVVDANSGAASAFKIGETLKAVYKNAQDVVITQVSAATVASVYLVSSVLMIDAHETGAQIHKYIKPGLIVDIDVNVSAPGDTDAVIGNTADRDVCINLVGVADARVNIFSRNGWTRAVRFTGCFAPQATGRALKLPNNANLDEQAYGYFFEAFGSTEFGKFEFVGRNCRHVFTTNTSSGTSRRTTNYTTTAGAKWNFVLNSIVVGNIDAGFDTHGGCYKTTFVNCHIIGVMGGREVNRATGFQQRGCSTRYWFCSAENVATGWRLASNTFDYDWDNKVELVNCTVNGYEATAVEIGATDVPVTLQKKHHFTLTNFSSTGNGEDLATSGNQGSPILIHSGDVITINGLNVGKFSNHPIRVTNMVPGRIGSIRTLNCIFDYVDSVSGDAPITFESAPTLPVVIDGWLGLTADVNSASPPTAWIRIDGVTGTGTSAVKLRVGRIAAPYRANNVTLFRYTNGSAEVNTEFIGIRESGREMYGQANATIESMPGGAAVTKTINVVGAGLGDLPTVNFSAATAADAALLVPSGIIMEPPRIITPGVVQVRFINITTTTSTAATKQGQLFATVTKRGAVL